MYTFDSNQPYTMPTCATFRDPRPWEAGGMRYGRVTSMTVSFLTDTAAVARCLPEPFRPADEPVVSVTFQKCEDVDWLAGRGYHLVGIDAAAIFDGQRDRDVHGNYCIVMWEDMCEPIIGGREHSGVPKIFGDVDFIQTDADAYECKLSRFSHQFMAMSVTQLQTLDDAACRDIEQTRRDSVWMNYKCIPRLENDGSDVSYATVYPSSGQVVEARSGKGSIEFMHATFKQVPTQHNAINLLADLPVREVRPSNVIHWKAVRAIDRLPRRLQ